ncbi:MAG TPA: flagellar motor switch protein FliN [Candidatus Acidoferrales bacterium]|nr:flagellar motor switch protein FliN [Candidatus Acidoferrales bacterium]
MSQAEQNQQWTIATVPNANQLLDQWASSLGQVLESMTDQKPEVRWQAGSTPDSHQDSLWWEQPFSAGPGVAVWVAAPLTTWEQAGTITLKAAGLETVETAEAKSTWIEILGQSLSVMARSIGSFVGREVTCESGAEKPPGPEPHESASVTIAFPGSTLDPLSIVLSPELLAILAPGASTSTAEKRDNHPVNEPEAANAERQPGISPTMELLMDVELPVSISFGKTQLPMKDVLKLTTGSIVELNRGVNETVEVLVNHCLIARGEVVVVDGNYGVRIQHIVSRQDRLRTVR